VSSTYLDDIIERQNQITSALIVSADIEKYSRRRTQAQVDVVDAFTENVSKALEDISREYVNYAQQNSVNFETDVIRLPTGDGMIAAFPFDGVPDIHLSFARALIKRVGEFNANNECDRFKHDGWCNCHSDHNLRLGVTEGKSVVYRDVNSAYNIAGSAVNLAVRVMNEADSNQILLSDYAYSQLIDLVDDPALSDQFRRFDNIAVKHGVLISLYQYVNERDEFLNNNPPSDPVIQQEMVDASEGLGMPIPMPGGDRVAQGRAIVEAMKLLGSLGDVFSPSSPPQPQIPPPSREDQSETHNADGKESS
jgi:class 3 adenylate cyclase